MYLKKSTKKYTDNYLDNINRALESMKNADAIVVGIGAGMSTSAGLIYSGERFDKYFSDFKDKYGITDMYSGGFYPFASLEEYWAWWSRHVYYNRYAVEVGKPYKDLLELIKDKNYFILTTNIDHQIQLVGFDKKRLYYMQGDYGLLQCSKPCHNKTYDNKEFIEKMVLEQKDMKIPSELIPYCPICNEPMAMNLRIDRRFVEDSGWHKAHNNYVDFIAKYEDKNIVFLELGVGENTPGIIQYPFIMMTYENENSRYIKVNINNSSVPKEISTKTIKLTKDIGEVIEDILELKEY